jgi:hypothetical protein
VQDAFVALFRHLCSLASTQPHRLAVRVTRNLSLASAGDSAGAGGSSDRSPSRADCGSGHTPEERAAFNQRCRRLRR